MIACHGVYDPFKIEDGFSMCFIIIGTFPRTPTTQKMHAGAFIFVHRTMKQNADQYFRSPFLSASKAQDFLRQMSNTTESDCDCLPDCELVDLQYSVTTNNLM